MLSPVLLLKPQNTTTSLLFSKAPLAQNTSTNRIQSHISHIQHTSILPTLILTSVVHHPTTSFNPILIHSNTTPPFCHLLTQIFQLFHNPKFPPPLLKNPLQTVCCPASLEQTPASIATNVCTILCAHTNLSPCHLSTSLSLQTDNPDL